MYAIIDCEGIQSTSNHICIRTMYILNADGTKELSLDFKPCKMFSELDVKFQKAFHYCKKHVHKLNFYPSQPFLLCQQASEAVKEYIEKCNIHILLYKGGIIEKRLCSEIGIRSYNIELLSVPKANCHEARREVHFYWNKIKNIDNIDELILL
jgi:hypothetical protein